MKPFRKALCALGSHPHVRFLHNTTGYIQCQDCRRIQKFGVAKRWDDPHPWIKEEDWYALGLAEADVVHGPPADHRREGSHG